MYSHCCHQILPNCIIWSFTSTEVRLLFNARHMEMHKSVLLL